MKMKIKIMGSLKLVDSVGNEQEWEGSIVDALKYSGGAIFCYCGHAGWTWLLSTGSFEEVENYKPYPPINKEPKAPTQTSAFNFKEIFGQEAKTIEFK